MAAVDQQSSKFSDLPVLPDVGPVASPIIKSAGRVLEILELFDELQHPLRVGDVAAHLNFPQSSTTGLLKCLVQLGYLDFNPTGRTYLPSLRVALLGTWLDSGPIRDGSLLRMLEDLSREVGHTVVLAVRQGTYSQYIHVLQARTPMRFFVPQGSRRLVVWSATGFALLSRGTDEEARSLCLRANVEARSDQPRVDVRRMLTQVRRVREKGYSFSKGLVTPGAGAIAMPLPSGIDLYDRPLAVGLTGPLSDFVKREAAIVEVMRNTIERYLASSAHQLEV